MNSIEGTFLFYVILLCIGFPIIPPHIRYLFSGAVFVTGLLTFILPAIVCGWGPLDYQEDEWTTK